MPNPKFQRPDLAAYCPLETQDDGSHICPDCGYVASASLVLPIFRRCPSKKQPPIVLNAPLVVQVDEKPPMLCHLERIPSTNDCRCTNCGTVFQDSDPADLKVRCAKEGLGQPPLVRRAFNFGKALGKHFIDVTAKLAHGKLDEAYRSDEEIDAIFATHCQPCPFFNGRICTHSKCGCNLGGQEKFLNKLKWRSETCPDGRWS